MHAADRRERARALLGHLSRIQGALGPAVGDDDPLRGEIRDVLDDARSLLADDLRETPEGAPHASQSDEPPGLLDAILRTQVAVLDPSFHFMMANEAYVQGCGIPASDLIGRDHFGLFPNAENQAIFERVRDSGKAVSFVSRPFVFAHAPERGVTYWDWDLVPIRGQSGSTSMLVLSLTDVTERERATQALQQERDLMARVFEMSPIGIITVGRDGRVESANVAVQQLLGVNVQDLLGRLYSDTLWGVAPANGAGHLANDDLLDSQRTLHDVTVSITRPDGSQASISVNGAPLRDGNGDVDGYVFTVEDITAQEAAHRERLGLLEELRAERARLEATFSSAPVGIVMVDAQGRYAFVNPRVRDLYRWPLALGTHYAAESSLHFRRPSGGAFASLELPLARSLWRGETVRNEELDVVWPDGQMRHLMSSSAPIPDGAGGVRGAVAVYEDITARKEAGRRLQLLRQQNDLILRSAGDGVIGLDAQGCLIFANPAAEHILGWSAAEMMGQNIHTLIHRRSDGSPCDIETCPTKQAYEQAQSFHSADQVFMRRDGRLVPVSLTASPMLVGDSVQGAVLTFQDITERKRTDEAMQRHAEYLRGLHSTDLAILGADTAREVAQVALDFLPRLMPIGAAAVLEVSATGRWATPVAVVPSQHDDRALRRHPLEDIPGAEGFADGQFVTLAMDALAEGQRTWVEELELAQGSSLIAAPLTVTGQLVGVLLATIVNLDGLAEGEKEMLRGVATQLAVGLQQVRLREVVQLHASELERRVSERTAELRSSEARFRTIYERSPVGIGLLTADGRIRDANAALRRTLGIQGVDSLDLTYQRLFPDRERAERQAQFEQLCADVDSHYETEVSLVSASGEIAWANLFVACVGDGIGGEHPPYAILMVEDITETRAAQRSLLKAEKMALVGRMSASLAHELNNPLQAVVGCIGLAQEALNDGGDASTYLDVAHSELGRAADIVTQLRGMVRADPHKEGELIDLTNSVWRVVGIIGQSAADAGVEIAVELPDAFPRIRGIEGQIRQVLLNLMLNAIDAMPTGGTLSVRAAQTQHPAGLQIQVCDTGLGIDPAVAEHLFEPYQSTKIYGLGLGLYISREIVRDHEGALTVDSEAGRGACFTAWFPAHPGE